LNVVVCGRLPPFQGLHGHFCLCTQVFTYLQGISTIVEQALQISLFMQNKANFPRFLAQKRDFAQKQSQFKPKTNPIYRTTKMSVSSVLTTVYKRNGVFAARKTKPIQSQFAEVLKMDVSLALARPYGDMPTLTARPNKPKQSQFRHLLRSGRILFDAAASAGRWVDRRLRLLCQGRTKKLPDALERLRKRYRGHKREAVDGLHRHILSNEEQIRLKNPPAILNHTPVHSTCNHSRLLLSCRSYTQSRNQKTGQQICQKIFL